MATAMRSRASCLCCAAFQGGPTSAQRHSDTRLPPQPRHQQQAAQQPDVYSAGPACSTNNGSCVVRQKKFAGPLQRKSRAAPSPIRAVTTSLHQATSLSTVQELVQNHGHQLDHIHISTILRKLVSFKQSDEVLWYGPAAHAAEQLQHQKMEERRRAQEERRRAQFRHARMVMEADGSDWQEASFDHVSDAAEESDNDTDAEDSTNGSNAAGTLASVSGSGSSSSIDLHPGAVPVTAASGRPAGGSSNGEYDRAALERRMSAVGASTSASAAGSRRGRSSTSRKAKGSSATPATVAAPLRVMVQARQEAGQQLRALLKRVVQLSCDRALQFNLQTAATTLEALVRLGYTDQTRVHSFLTATQPLIQELHSQPSSVGTPAAAAVGAGSNGHAFGTGLQKPAQSMAADWQAPVAAPAAAQEHNGSSNGIGHASCHSNGHGSRNGSSNGNSSVYASINGNSVHLEQPRAGSHAAAHEASDIPSAAALAQPSGQVRAQDHDRQAPNGFSKSQWRRHKQRQRRQQAAEAAAAALTNRSIISLVWACAELQLTPPDGWLADVEGATLASLSSMSVEEVVALVSALARLKHIPSQAWLVRCEEASITLLPSCPPAQAARLLEGFAHMRHRPDDEWMEAFLTATAPLLNSLQAPQLTDVLKVLSKMSCKPNDAWMTAFYESMLQQLQQQRRSAGSNIAGMEGSVLSAEQLTAMVAALARLSCRPDSTWLNECLLRSRRCLPGAGATQLAHLIQGLSALRFRASEAWLQHFLTAAHCRLPYASPQECCRMVVALAKLGQKPQGLWLQELTGRVRGRLSMFSSGQLADLACSLVRLGYRPDAAWLAEFERCSGSKLEQCSSEGLAAIAWALAEMGYRPEVSWLYSYVLSAYHQLDSFSAAQLQIVFEALPIITPYPGWLDELVQICANESSPVMRSRQTSWDEGQDVRSVQVQTAEQGQQAQLASPGQTQQASPGQTQQQQQQQGSVVAGTAQAQQEAAQQQQQQRGQRLGQGQGRLPEGQLPTQPLHELWPQQPLIIGRPNGDCATSLWATAAKTSSCLA